MTCVLAIDIGGTKLAAALVDESGFILRSATRPTPRTEVMPALAALIAEVTEGGPPPVAVGIGCAGPLDLATGTVSPVNMPSWRGFPLRDEVRRLTGLPTMLAGDAQCFALGEHWLGAGRGCSSLLGIVVSTGIGGGLVIDGAPLLGPTGNAGHVGHMSIDPYGERCECGGRGCVERYSSGPNMTRWALDNGWTPTAEDEPLPLRAEGRPAATAWAAGPGMAHPRASHTTADPAPHASGVSGTEPPAGASGAAAVAKPGGGHDAASSGSPAFDSDPDAFSVSDAEPTAGASGRATVVSSGVAITDSGGHVGVMAGNGGKADARALARDAAAGHPVAVAAFERGARALAGMIASTAAAVEVTTVVVGGGVSGAGKVLFDPLERALDDVAGLAFVRAVQLKQSTLGVRAALAGAANLAWQAIRSKG